MGIGSTHAPHLLPKDETPILFPALAASKRRNLPRGLRKTFAGQILCQAMLEGFFSLPVLHRKRTNCCERCAPSTRGTNESLSQAFREPLASLAQHFRTARARHAQTLRKGVQLRTLPIMRVRVVFDRSEKLFLKFRRTRDMTERET